MFHFYIIEKGGVVKNIRMNLTILLLCVTSSVHTALVTVRNVSNKFTIGVHFSTRLPVVPVKAISPEKIKKLAPGETYTTTLPTDLQSNDVRQIGFIMQTGRQISPTRIFNPEKENINIEVDFHQRTGHSWKANTPGVSIGALQ